MQRPTVEQATGDLMHLLANFLLVAGEARVASASGIPRLLSDAEIGAYTIHHEPALREAFDNLKAAQVRALFDEPEHTELDEAELDEDGMGPYPERDYDDHTYHQAKDDALTEHWN